MRPSRRTGMAETPCPDTRRRHAGPPQHESSTATAPAKNISRCGALDSSAGSSINNERSPWSANSRMTGICAGSAWIVRAPGVPPLPVALFMWASSVVAETQQTHAVWCAQALSLAMPDSALTQINGPRRPFHSHRSSARSSVRMSTPRRCHHTAIRHQRGRIRELLTNDTLLMPRVSLRIAARCRSLTLRSGNSRRFCTTFSIHAADSRQVAPDAACIDVV